MFKLGNFEQKLLTIVLDTSYKYYGVPKIMASNFRSKLSYNYYK